MAKVRISVNKQELKYKGIYFPFGNVKQLLTATMDKEQYAPKALFLKHCIHKTFNSTTGHIDRKYAWDSVFQELKDEGLLARVLEDILFDEYLK